MTLSMQFISEEAVRIVICPYKFSCWRKNNNTLTHSSCSSMPKINSNGMHLLCKSITFLYIWISYILYVYHRPDALFRIYTYIQSLKTPDESHDIFNRVVFLNTFDFVSIKKINLRMLTWVNTFNIK